MISVNVQIMLLSHVESNPGPKSNLAIRTYNCFGMGNTHEFRRVPIICTPLYPLLKIDRISFCKVSTVFNIFLFVK